MVYSKLYLTLCISAAALLCLHIAEVVLAFLHGFELKKMFSEVPTAPALNLPIPTLPTKEDRKRYHHVPATNPALCDLIWFWLSVAFSTLAALCCVAFVVFSGMAAGNYKAKFLNWVKSCNISAISALVCLLFAFGFRLGFFLGMGGNSLANYAATASGVVFFTVFALGVPFYAVATYFGAKTMKEAKSKENAPLPKYVPAYGSAAAE